MVPSRLYRMIALALALFSAAGMTAGCRRVKSQYLELAKPAEHTWLKGRKIFIDPGHGGKGDTDPFRIGPKGVSEEEINLHVALILEELLIRAGADVELSRRRDKDVSLDERVAKAEKFGPELLVSIHHNGTIRRMDGVNYPSVLYWGSGEVNPASLDFARILLEGLERVVESKGGVYSDFSIFRETGTRILRQTSSLCPGVIGEGGFFSDEKHAIRLKDRHYLEDEALAYFYAISRYLQWGIPSMELVFSCIVEDGKERPNFINERSPIMALKILSGNENPGIDQKSLMVTLDGVPVRCDTIGEGLYSIHYGKELFPGTHRVRAMVKNLRGQSAMLSSAEFTLAVEKGDYQRLIDKGKQLIYRTGSTAEGLLMIMAALSMGPTDPGSDELLWHASNGFHRIGAPAQAEYFRNRILHFYTTGPIWVKLKGKVHGSGDYFFPVEHHGREMRVKGEYDFCKYSLPCVK